jgi:lysophospholipase L1-like esterase
VKTIKRLIVCYAVYCCLVTSPSRGDESTLLRSVELSHNDTIAFIGDSITHQCLYTQYIEDYYYTRLPNTRLRFYNGGVGGSRTSDVLARFDEDIVPVQPKYVAVLLGMNDGSYKRHNRATFQIYQQEMTSIIEKISDLGAKPILITPTVFDIRAHRNAIANGLQDTRNRSPSYNGVLALYGAWLREQAYENGLGFVDMHGPLNRITFEQRKTDADFSLTLEGIHPNPTGHMIMAHTYLRDINASTNVSAIHVMKTGETWQADCLNGSVTKLQAEDNIRFTFLADSLPWVVPKDAQHGYQLVDAGSTMSLETLRVSDLPPGKYQLKIDRQRVGDYSHWQLAQGIELQENVKTPQYQQSQRVAQLNARRNQLSVYVLRDLWSQLKDRRKRTQSQDESFGKWYATFQKKVTELHRSIEKQEDQIYQTNQPEAREYEIINLK